MFLHVLMPPNRRRTILRRVALILTATIAVTLTVCGTASAHWLRTPYYIKHRIHSNTWRLKAWRMNLYHADAAIKYFNLHTDQAASKEVQAHLFIIRLSKARITSLTQPKLPAHYAGWICIHKGEGAWYSNTGNGYYNGLQMTWNWGNGIVGNPNNYTPLEIMWAAERGYISSGYSSSWLAGQWPNTYPPCSRYF